MTNLILYIAICLVLMLSWTWKSNSSIALGSGISVSGPPGLSSSAAVEHVVDASIGQGHQQMEIVIRIQAILQIIRDKITIILSPLYFIRDLVDRISFGGATKLKLGSSSNSGANGGSLKGGDLIWRGIPATQDEVDSVRYILAARDMNFNTEDLNNKSDKIALQESVEGKTNDSSSDIKKKTKIGPRKRDLFKRAMNKTFVHSAYLHEIKDVEILRFLRFKKGNRQETIAALIKHAKWRDGKLGTDFISKDKHRFDGSHMHRELFWLGLSKDDSAILVVRDEVIRGLICLSMFRAMAIAL